MARILDTLGIDLAAVGVDVRSDLVAVYRASGEAGLREVLADPGDKLFGAVNAGAANYAGDRAAELVTEITETTRDDLRATITQAFTDGMSPAELSQAIRDSFSFSPERADMIARTELAAAHVEGTLRGWLDSGVVEGKELILSDDHDKEDDCDDAESMGVVALDDDFGGLGDPPLHPNCACDVLPVLTDESEPGLLDEGGEE